MLGAAAVRGRVRAHLLGRAVRAGGLAAVLFGVMPLYSAGARVGRAGRTSRCAHGWSPGSRSRSAGWRWRSGRASSSATRSGRCWPRRRARSRRCARRSATSRSSAAGGALDADRRSTAGPCSPAALLLLLTSAPPRTWASTAFDRAVDRLDRLPGADRLRRAVRDPHAAAAGAAGRDDVLRHADAAVRRARVRRRDLRRAGHRGRARRRRAGRLRARDRPVAAPPRRVGRASAYQPERRRAGCPRPRAAVGTSETISKCWPTAVIASRRWTALVPRTSSSRRFSRRARRLAASRRARPRSPGRTAPAGRGRGGGPRRLHPAHLLVEHVRVLQVQLAAERYRTAALSGSMVSPKPRMPPSPVGLDADIYPLACGDLIPMRLYDVRYTRAPLAAVRREVVAPSAPRGARRRGAARAADPGSQSAPARIPRGAPGPRPRPATTPPAPDRRGVDRLLARPAGRPARRPALRRHHGAGVRARGELREGRVAGAILFRDNATGPRRLPALPRQLRRGRGAPVCVDQEGGDIRNLPWAPPAPRRPRQAAAGTSAPTPTRRRALRAAGRQRRAGAGRGRPDVAARRRRPRVLHRPGAAAAARSPTAVRGWRAGRRRAHAKHFPGLGGATVNTDDGPATIAARARRSRRDLAPFRPASPPARRS